MRATARLWQVGLSAAPGVLEEFPASLPLLLLRLLLPLPPFCPSPGPLQVFAFMSALMPGAGQNSPLEGQRIWRAARLGEGGGKKRLLRS